MHLIIGDAVVSNPQAWHLADIDLSFPGEVSVDAKPNVDGLQTHIVEGVKPEIKHTFRQPEKRPPAIISNAFTVLCLVPILIMIGCWMKVNYKHFLLYKSTKILKNQIDDKLFDLI